MGRAELALQIFGRGRLEKNGKRPEVASTFQTARGGRTENLRFPLRSEGEFLAGSGH